MKKITKKSVQKMIEEYIKTEQFGIDEHNEIKAILQQCEGKQFNMVTFRNKLGDYRFIGKYGQFRLQKGNGFEHLIGYDSDLINSERFEELDNCCGNAAIERIEKLKNIDVDMIVKLFGNIEKSVLSIMDSFKEIEKCKLRDYNNPIYYDLLRSFCKFTQPYQLVEM